MCSVGAGNKCMPYYKDILGAAGASVIASGQLVASPGSKQAVEIKADKLTLVGGCDPETYPLQKVRCNQVLFMDGVRVPAVDQHKAVPKQSCMRLVMPGAAALVHS